MAAEIGVAQRQSQVQSEFEKLSGTVDRLEKTIDSLESRFNTVLRSPEPILGCEIDNKKATEQVHFAVIMSSLRTRVVTVCDRIKSIESRCEV